MGAQAVRLSNVDIDNAIKNKEFEVLFQPIFDLNNGALARVESFIRWRHAALGVLPPGAFISFFETQGRMGELTRYVLSEALSKYNAWRGPFTPGFSINLAHSDLADEAFVSHFSVLLREHNFPAELITLECPMPPVDVDLQLAQQNFGRLADTGARLAIEVRGRTNDFLRKIDPFPFDEIKTGGAAILRFARTVRGPGLSAISELLELATASNAAITAVGVEDQPSLSALRSLGFSAAQGNHLGKVGDLNSFTPSRVNEVRELLGLTPLDKDALAALFRTGAPAVDRQPAQTAATPDERFPAHETGDLQSEGDEDLIDRLAARIAENDSAAKASAAKPVAVEKKQEARKAAAIARAKRKSAPEPEPSAEAPGAPSPVEDADAASSAPTAKDLQKRLTDEFDEEPAAAQTSPTIPAARPKRKSARAPTRRRKRAITAKKAVAAQSPAAPVASGQSGAPAEPELSAAQTPEDGRVTDDSPSASHTSREPAAGQPVEASAETANSEPGETPVPLERMDTKNTPAEGEPAAAAPGESTVESPSPEAEADISSAEEAEPRDEAPSGDRGLKTHTDEKDPAPDGEKSESSPPDRLVVEGSLSKNALEDPLDNPPSDPAPMKTTMPVNTASAQFIPVLRVGGEPGAPAPAAAPRPAARPTPGATPSPVSPGDIQVEDPANVQVDQFASPPAEPPKEDPSLGSFEVNENAPLAEEDAESFEPQVSSPRFRAKQKKNFLTRKYKIRFWPTHFWPKSWKRAWRRRAAYRAELQAANETA